MKYTALFSLMIATCCWAADPAPGADTGMGGDLGGSGGGQKVDWVPVIRSFYLVPDVSGKQTNPAPLKLEYFDTQTLPSELLQWNALKQVIERPKDENGQPRPYVPSDQVVVGWRYNTQTNSGNP